MRSSEEIDRILGLLPHKVILTNLRTINCIRSITYNQLTVFERIENKLSELVWLGDRITWRAFQ